MLSLAKTTVGKFKLNKNVTAKLSLRNDPRHHFGQEYELRIMNAEKVK